MKPIILFCFFLIYCFNGLGCSCLPNELNDTTFSKYTLVFKGTAIKSETEGYTTRIQFRIEKKYKGSVTFDTVTISTPSDGAMCGISVSIGDEWLIFSNKDAKGFNTYLCDFNVQNLKQNKIAQEYLKFLEERAK